MATLQSRRGPNAEEPSQDKPSAKRLKAVGLGSTSAPGVAPAGSDNRFKTCLTPRVLRELDERSSACSCPETSAVSSMTPTNLAQFARHGGPDLSHLRDNSDPKYAAPSMYSGGSSRRPSQWTQCTNAMPPSPVSKHSSAYDKDFEQKLIDHNIYPGGYEYPDDDDSIPEPGNLNEIAHELLAPRASLSPSRFPPSSFQQFSSANDRVISEGKVMSRIFPTMRGDANIPNEGDLPFTNLDSITHGDTVNAKPDFFDGTYPSHVSKTVQQDLYNTIIPTSHDLPPPLAPNFFFEAIARRGSADVAKRQACLDGAYGARAMHGLQNYREEEPVYDGNAYTISSTYHAGTGTLQLHAHHITAPTAEGEGPEYHMTQIDSWGMTENMDTFRRGVAAFRNARDVAQRYRDGFIQAANATASEAGEVAAQGYAEGDNPPSGHAGHVGGDETWRDSHDDLQRQIANDSYGNPSDDAADDAPRHLYTADDGSQESTQEPTASVGSDNPSFSFTPTLPSQGTEHRSKVHFRDPEGREVKTERKNWMKQMMDRTRCFYRQSSKSGLVFWSTKLPREAKKKKKGKRQRT
ncbi:hypothetical protein QQS21_011942 [Conoideocrella luteorostrata]|uniref:Uncharacterized protein n=1 Tax=Conoideocrella luteorostrata TaxID=1105319 RepID=A0AAJ0CC64_9HYPO|nr:hypothetical protein QQS21_011942 [Conoideocrella luteorostrata]